MAIIQNSITASLRQYKIGIPKKLVEIGAKEEDLQRLAKMAYADVCTPGNPRETSVEDILRFIRKHINKFYRNYIKNPYGMHNVVGIFIYMFFLLN